MNIFGREISPIALTCLIIMFGIAVGVSIMNYTNIGESYQGQIIESEESQESASDPLVALKMKLINKEISPEEYERLKEILSK